MRRKLLLLDLALLAALAGTGWRVRDKWNQARHREQMVLRQPLKPLPPPPVSPLPAAEPVTAAAYVDIAQKMLFSPDRNPTVVVEAPKPKPMPPLPIANGVMNLGGGPMAILAEKSGAEYRAVRPGEKIGAFTLVAVSGDEIALEWEGKEVRRKLDELRERKQGEPGPISAAPVPRASAAPSTAASVSSQGAPAGPGVDAGGGVRGCLPGDTSPPGTVVNGFRKVVSDTPFGKVCHWEPAK